MEVLNLAASALIQAFEKNSLDKSLLIEGTSVKLEELQNLKKKHSWDDFVKMYDNCALHLGYQNVAKEIGYQGIYNDNISLLTKVARNLIDIKSLYWYVATFVAKHLFKESVVFKYSSVGPSHVRMEIIIASDLKDCPLLFETYVCLFENLPNLLGLPFGKVSAEISSHKASYDIYLKQTTLIKKAYSKVMGLFKSDASSIQLMEQLEVQSEELSQAVEEKSQLLRIVSHDVANQVTTIDYYLNKLLQSKELSPEEKRYLNITKSSVSKLTNILRNVQNMESTSLRGVALSPVDVGEIFKFVLENFEPQLKHKDIKLTCNNHLPKNVKVMAEALSLETNVLGNLVTNAIKFSERGSQIELLADLDNENVLISVVDQGIGMTLEQREKIFSKKIRKSLMGTNGEMGSGFGLGIVASYVNMFNGKINITSNNPKGTVFTIVLQAHRH